MSAPRLLLTLLVVLLLLLLHPAAAARGDGPPITSLDSGPEGVVELGGDERFTALPAGDDTILTRSQTHGGRVERAAVLEGRWGVPLVANDGTAGGLSADGRTLALLRVADRYPRRRSSFAIADTGSLHARETVALEGEWGFDALSPDGRWLYLIAQLSARDRTRYAVRVYDLAQDRLLPEPVVDPREPDEPMRGLPITRATGPGGRWEYTLYAGGEHPFIHALDTVARTSLCLDLPHSVTHDRRLLDARLAVRGGRVTVLSGDEVLASAARRPPAARRSSVGGGPPWVAAVAGAAGLLLAAGGLRRRMAHGTGERAATGYVAAQRQSRREGGADGPVRGLRQRVRQDDGDHTRR
jgi:hypothetical protein